MKSRIIVEAEAHDSPKDHELTAAIIIADYFESEVIFIVSSNFRTPDFCINGTTWELKSPMGSSARTIENNMRTARKQSENIIVDLRRIKMHQQRAMSRLNSFLTKSSQFNRVLVITKAKKVIEIK